MMSRWPLVTGSNDPGHTARRITLSAMIGATVPKLALSVPSLCDERDARRPGRFGTAYRALHHQYRARREPAAGDQSGEDLAEIVIGEVVRRIGEDQIELI